MTPLETVTPAGILNSDFVWTDAKRNREVPVRIYAPAQSDGRRPLVIFSHGIGEDRDSYQYIGRALASNGFVTVHITHAGTDKAVLKQGYWKLYKATKNMENWINRPLDVSFVIDKMLERGGIDPSRIAVVGHSAGAFTAFALAGVHGSSGQNFRDERVRVIVPMSMPRIEGLTYEEISIPVLNITGTCDSSIIYRTRQRHRRIPFEQTHAHDQYLATIEHVNHNSFSNAEDAHHSTILTLTIAFLRAYLLDDQNARRLFAEPGTVDVHGDRVALEMK